MRRRLPRRPTVKPKPVSTREQTFELRRLQSQLNEMQWQMRAKEALPKGWGNVESEHPVRLPKVKMTLRLDEDVAIYFRWQGEGYQARINAILRMYMLSRLGVDPADDARHRGR